METMDDLAREFKAHHDEVKAVLEKAGLNAEKISELHARMLDLEQKSARRRDGGFLPPDTWGAQVTRADSAKALSSGWKGRARFDVKATITSATTDAAGSAGTLVPPDRQTSIIELPRRKLRVRQLFTPGQTSSNLIQWPKQKGRTNNAATVAEGALKPQSDLQFEMGNWAVTTLAHWMLASRQILDDSPALMSIIDSELRYGLEFVEDDQFLNGLGTGTDLLGVYTGATAFTPQFDYAGNPTMIDVLLQAIAQVDDTEFDADGIVLNPLDWRVMQSLKDSQDRYLGGGPFGDLVQRLWQLPIVTSKAVARNKFLVGAFKAGAQIFDREDATVEISTEDSDNFRKNLVTILGEERLAFVVKHADVFVKGDFNDAITG
jgi:HK97 family phage major capsid protein